MFSFFFQLHWDCLDLLPRLSLSEGRCGCYMAPAHALEFGWLFWSGGIVYQSDTEGGHGA